MKPLKQQQFTDSDLSRLVSNVREWADQFKDIPFLDGRLLEDVEVSSSVVTSISHGLGRVPTGFLVLKRTGDVRVWDRGSDKIRLVLDASSSGTVSIWVF